jgi:hypothetical protein
MAVLAKRLKREYKLLMPKILMNKVKHLSQSNGNMMNFSQEAVFSVFSQTE